MIEFIDLIEATGDGEFPDRSEAKSRNRHTNHSPHGRARDSPMLIHPVLVRRARVG